MRAVGPARTMARKVTALHTRGGCELAPGDTVFLSIAAANHDEARLRRARRDRPRARRRTRTSASAGVRTSVWERTSRGWRRASRCDALLERFPKLRAAAALAPLAGGTMGFARRLLVTQLGG